MDCLRCYFVVSLELEFEANRKETASNDFDR